MYCFGETLFENFQNVMILKLFPTKIYNFGIKMLQSHVLYY